VNETALPPGIETAQIDWQDGQPVCQRFNDAHFDREHGLEEARHVFVASNRLAERFARIGRGEHFVVAETGFGSGLNFLATCQQWLESNQASSSCLHFVSVERYPLTWGDLAKAHALWPELKPLSTELLDQYPSPIKGTHRLVLGGGRVRLTLYFGEVLEAWAALDFTADAWFLDGFMPDCNPEMWHGNVIAEVANHSRTGTSMATFTNSADVRRDLSNAGFTVTESKGFGRKQNMLSGQFDGKADSKERCRSGCSNVGVIGAGVSGCMLAANLAGRGFTVTLIDKADKSASGASGNSQGALYVKLGVDFNDQTELALSSLLFAQRFYAQFQSNGWHPTGLIQLAHNASEADRQKRFLAKNHYPQSVVRAVDSNTASEIAGQPVPYSGLWYPSSGWLQPVEISSQLAAQPNVTHRYGCEVKQLEQTQKGWRVKACNGDTLDFDQIVLCAGAETPDIIPIDGKYRIKKIRGQVSEVPDHLLDAPSVVLCGPGYVNPSYNNRATVGATFDLHDSSDKVSPISDQENLEMLSSLLPEALTANAREQTFHETVKGRVAFRCTTHDYQPIVGPLKTCDGAVLKDVFLFTGLGSKGLTYSTLLAEYLADVISLQPLSLPRHLIRRVETQRCHQPQVTHS